MTNNSPILGLIPSQHQSLLVAPTIWRITCEHWYLLKWSETYNITASAVFVFVSINYSIKLGSKEYDILVNLGKDK